MSAVRTEMLADDVTLFLGDCREIAPSLKRDIAVVSDVPYGMNWNTDSTRFSAGDSGLKIGKGRNDWGDIESDAEPFDPSPWLEYPECIVWGANHYAQRLPLGSTLIWIKKPAHMYGAFLSDAEIGWQKGGHGVYLYYEQFPPPSRAAEAGGKVAHPTQKPIGLMGWCIDRTKSRIILDPYMGSGSTGVAAVKRGRGFYGIEKVAKYFDTACQRVSEALKQPDMFVDKPKPLKQEAFKL